MSQEAFFRPSTTEIPVGSPSLTQHDVTVPLGAEIVKPVAQLLEHLLCVKGVVYKPAPIAQIFEEMRSYKKRNNAPTGDIYANVLEKTRNQAHTRNNDKAYNSTMSAVLDAFSGLNARSSAQDIHKQLAASWEQSPALTLRLMWNMRSIHEGHSNKIGFYHAFGWLYKKHPKTAVENLRFLVERLCERKIKHKPRKPESDFETTHPEDTPTEETIRMPHGCYKDLLNIVVLAMRDELGDSTLDRFESLNVPPVQGKRQKINDLRIIKSTKQRQNQKLGVDAAKALRAQQSHKSMATQAEKAKAERRVKRKADFALLRFKLTHDKSFLALYAAVAQIFAEALADDVALLKKFDSISEYEALSLRFELTGASKWAPTLEGFHDRVTNISTAIALVLYARGHMPDLSLELGSEMSLESAHTLRGYYRRWIISPLRRFTDVTEVKMSEQDWYNIDYDHVPSKCIEANKKQFFEHDEMRFTRIRESGSLEGSLAVVDVSESMGTIKKLPKTKEKSTVKPIFPAIALGLLLAAISKPPFNEMFITFSANPRLLKIHPGGLAEKARWIASTESGMNTNYESVFLDLLLPAAIKHKLKDMIKRLFVFSDMQFDASIGKFSKNSWESSHARIAKAYKKAGYTLPEIFYWDLQGGVTKPILKNTSGTALITGFSANMIKLFLDGKNTIDRDTKTTQESTVDPLAVMEMALSKQCYDALRVYD
ncbi:hypothetical protein RhiJN_19224 [Ceratobasidium sp. AG-Ba]|nr:hypothetical protein RhiJN_19224 [Ceratobasidium sp. AG-Ba]